MSAQIVEAWMLERLPERVVSTSCPACGGANDEDAIFCANPVCHKALGPFAYVQEELHAKTRWYERLADRATDFISRPHFLVVHSLWFVLWLVANTGIFAIVGKFDDYPYNLLGLILSVESIFITGFLLISQNRQHAHADKRAELDYEVSVRTYREIDELKELVHAMQTQLTDLAITIRAR
ncbi:MAG: DUF1003 domain-containing protein [Pyrinomonadaceae bacterium]